MNVFLYFYVAEYFMLVQNSGVAPTKTSVETVLSCIANQSI